MPTTVTHSTHSGSVLTRPLGKGVVVCVFAGLLALVVWAWGTLRIGVVVSDSMVPTLIQGDAYVIRVDAYREHGPERGDVVVVKRDASSPPLVKRVIAIGGDWVGVMFGRAWVNGQYLQEPYLAKNQRLIRERPILGQVPKGELFVMGDNRNFSEDSRDIGTLPVKNVIGRADAIVYPFDRRHKIDHPEVKVPPPSAVQFNQPASRGTSRRRRW